MEVHGTRTYYATSAFTDPQNWFNFVVTAIGVLQLPDFQAVVPAKYSGIMLLVAALANVALRTFFSDRPLAMIPPGDVKPKQVKAVHTTLPTAEETDRGGRNIPPAVGLLLATALAFSVSCAGHTPPNLTPDATKVWQANEAVVALSTVQHAAIELNKVQKCAAESSTDCKPLVSDRNVRTIIDSVAVGVKTIQRVPSGWYQSSLAALDEASRQLDTEGKTTLASYIQAARSVLAALLKQPQS